MEEKRLDSLDTHCLHRLLGIHWFYQVPVRNTPEHTATHKKTDRTATSLFTSEEKQAMLVWSYLSYGCQQTSKDPVGVEPIEYMGGKHILDSTVTRDAESIGI